MRSILVTTGAVVWLMVFAQAASAAVVNGGFESGDFTGWATIGDALVVDSTIGSGPTEGTFQAFITTSSDNGDLNNFSGTDAVPAADLEVFLGLAAGSLVDAFEGSAIKQTFTAEAGEVLRFDYNFLTTEGGNPDFAFVVLGTSSTLADTTSGTMSPSLVELDPVFGDPARETGFLTFSFTLATAGTYTLGIGVVDALDEFIPSALLVDNVRLEAASAQVVPEPGSLLLFSCGLLCLGGHLRRRRARHSP